MRRIVSGLVSIAALGPVGLSLGGCGQQTPAQARAAIQHVYHSYEVSSASSHGSVACSLMTPRFRQTSFARCVALIDRRPPAPSGIVKYRGSERLHDLVLHGNTATAVDPMSNRLVFALVDGRWLVDQGASLG